MTNPQPPEISKLVAASPILDYASPRPRTKMRLPACSLVTIRWDDDARGVRITERLAGIGRAIGGMIFALFVLLVMGLLLLDSMQIFSHGRFRFNGDALVLLIFWLTEATLLVIVAAQTWRRTMLHARDGQLVLVQSGLFGKTVYRWGFGQIDELEVVPTQTGLNKHMLAELQFRVDGNTAVHLFTDHKTREVNEIRIALDRIMAITGA